MVSELWREHSHSHKRLDTNSYYTILSIECGGSVAIFSYRLRYIAGLRLAEVAISVNPGPTLYRNFHENTGHLLI